MSFWVLKNKINKIWLLISLYFIIDKQILSDLATCNADFTVSKFENLLDLAADFTSFWALKTSLVYWFYLILVLKNKFYLYFLHLFAVSMISRIFETEIYKTQLFWALHNRPLNFDGWVLLFLCFENQILS